jgi:hypothetical protein
LKAEQFGTDAKRINKRPSVVAVSGTGDNLGHGRDQRQVGQPFSFKQAYIFTYFFGRSRFLETLTVSDSGG